jgi:glycosyltransferase involved in cell wall biosynthesis
MIETSVAATGTDDPRAADELQAERPIRVAQVVTRLSAGAGGITLRGALGLHRDRYQTTIFAAEGGLLTDAAEAAGMTVVPLRHMAIGRGLYPWVDGPGYRELLELLSHGDFDIVHTHSAKAGALGRLAAYRLGIPAIVHSFHGFPFHQFQSPPVRQALLAIERRLARVTDYFLTDGTVVAAEAVRLKIAPPERIRAIASPVDSGIPVATPENRAQARRMLGIPQEDRVVGTAARLESQKAPVDMVRAIAGLDRSDIRVVWFGDGPLRARTQRLIDRSGLHDRFHLAGNRDDVAALLPALDVFAMSSLYEGLPCAVVEAMICGIPVVATAVNSVPEIVLSGKTGLLARAGDPASLGRALAYLIDHPAEGSRMAAEARLLVGGRFQADVLGDDLAQAYTIALRDAPVRPRSLFARGARR